MRPRPLAPTRDPSLRPPPPGSSTDSSSVCGGRGSGVPAEDDGCGWRRRELQIRHLLRLAARGGSERPPCCVLRTSTTARARATAMGSMTIGAKYKTTLKDPGTTGVLRMNEDNFTFTPNDPRSAMKLNVDFRSIKGHKFNKVDGSKPAPPLLNILKDSGKGGGYMFEFDSVSNRDLCCDFVARVLGKQQGTVRPRLSVLPENSITSTGPEQLSSAEMQCRMKLLQEDRCGYMCCCMNCSSHV